MFRPQYVRIRGFESHRLHSYGFLLLFCVDLLSICAVVHHAHVCTGTYSSTAVSVYVPVLQYQYFIILDHFHRTIVYGHPDWIIFTGTRACTGSCYVLQCTVAASRVRTYVLYDLWLGHGGHNGTYTTRCFTDNLTLLESSFHFFFFSVVWCSTYSIPGQ